MRYFYIIILFSINIFAASENYNSHGYNLIEKFHQDGKISYQEQLLQKFYYIFDKQKLAPQFKFENDYPVKCATSLILEYQKNKHLLDQRIIDEIEHYLHPSKFLSPTAFTYDSPGGKFRLTYETTGPNAVPTTDSNGNGIPDFVEWVANYFDYVWAFEVDTLGFLPPPIGSGKYQIGFEEMSAYGYTTVVSGTLTRIVMHRNFQGFPPNQDPEGNVKGAAKVTAAHEFKHATQIIYNYWSEPSWYIELDATWMEDIAYDYVNDYYNYINSSGSPFTSPGQSLDAGQGYEDCNWMIFLSEKFDVNINKRIWQRRQSNPVENIFSTFNFVLSSFYSSNFNNAFREYILWNFLTNSRVTTTHPGYGEAISYPLASLCRTVTSYPHNGSNCTITKYSSNFIRINPPSNSNNLLISFNGANSPHVFKLTIVTRNISNFVQSFELPLDANNDGTFLIPIPNNQLQYAGLCIAVVSGNTGPTFTYSISEQSAYSTTVNLNSGWNLLSIPLQLSNMNFSSIFPEATSNAYSYDNGYQTASSAELGKGYWLKFNQSLSKDLIGNPQTSVTVNVKTGWNIIGPLHVNAPVVNVTTNPPNIIQSFFYGYNNGYQTASNLEKGKGYWVKVSSNGTMTIPTTLFKTEEYLAELKAILSNSCSMIFEDSEHNKANLFLTYKTPDKSFFELPPAPPANVFDIRFIDNTFVDGFDKEEYVIQLNGVKYPLLISFNGLERRVKVYDATTEEILSETTNGRILINFVRGNMLKIRLESTPAGFALEQNYPNPFNPMTNIKFSLPDDARVKLILYNSLGKEIGVLIDKNYRRGFHNYEFNSDHLNLSSGVYFYKLIATGVDGSSFVKTRKMILMK